MENIAIFNSKHIGELQPTLRPEMAIETRHFNISLYLQKTFLIKEKIRGLQRQMNILLSGIQC